MPGFANLDEIISAVSVSLRGQTLFFNKRLAATSVANVPHTTWTATGNPAAGANPTLGMAGAVVVTSATTGAMPFTNPTGGRTMHALSMSALSTVGGTGSVILVDRIAHAQINNNQGTASFSPIIDATSRLGTGEGCMGFMEVTGALSAAANTRTFTYTNQAGSSPRTTPNIVTVASAVVGRVPYADFVWIPLQAGDTGIRSIQSTTLVSGTATGSYNIVLVNPLAPPMPLSAASLLTDRDLVVDIPSLPLIRSDACLNWIWVPTSAAVATLHGEVRIAEN